MDAEDWLKGVEKNLVITQFTTIFYFTFLEIRKVLFEAVKV
jgi:hypothetical protein